MATSMEYEGDSGGRYDEEPRYEGRDRSRSPRPAKDDGYDRARSASPNGRVASRGPERSNQDEPGARNTGSNLFVTGIHPRLSEEDVTSMFQKYGQVESCSIMKDPHTHESRGFGFVKMATADDADAARDALQNQQVEGRNLSIEKARRDRPRTPTPGRYFGPPKRDDVRGGRGGRYDDRRDRYRDDYYRGGSSRYDDRDRGYSRRDDYGSSRGGDRYGSGRRDDYDRRDDRRGGGGSAGGGGGYDDRYGRDSGYERPARDAAYAGSDDRYSRR